MVTATLKIGRIAGVEVGVNWSALAIVLLIVSGLAGGQLPNAYPRHSTVVYVMAALITAVLFLASLLAHELAHAAVARRNGVDVQSITLWLLGGVAQLRGEPRSPGSDFRIAVIGPLTSLVVGLLFGMLATVAVMLDADRMLTGLLAYLAATNIVLAVFNLLPAAPLDGGRVLRAALWHRTGDRERSAITAARSGRAFGFLLAGLGLLQALLTQTWNGLWLVLVGWFLVSAATAEEQQARTTSKLSGLRVNDVMTKDPVVADGSMHLDVFVDRLAMTNRFSSYPLVDHEGRLNGLVTLNRVRAVPGGRWPDTRLRDVACPSEEVPTTGPEEPLTTLLPRLQGCADGRAVVLDEQGRVIGIISSTDISRAMQLVDLRSMESYPPPRGADLTTAGTER